MEDSKGFLLEIFCTILLILIGLMFSKVKFKMHSDPFIVDIDDMGENVIYYGGTFSDNFKNSNVTSKISNRELASTGIRDFYNEIYDKKADNCFAGVYVISENWNEPANNLTPVAEYVIFINAQAKMMQCISHIIF